MSNAKFGEPWSFAEWKDSKRRIFTCDGIGVCMPGYNKWKARIIACVNALVGIEDPEAEIARLRKIEAATRTYNEGEDEDAAFNWEALGAALNAKGKLDG